MKNRSLLLQLCSDYIFEGCAENKNDDAPKYEKERFKELNSIDDKYPVFLEIGSGKGRFITQKALQNPDSYYLACEGGLNINIRIMQKARELRLQNIKVITDYITAPTLWFPENSLDGIYINFCDPWPKDRHAHRRLTYRKMLEGYIAIAKPGAYLEFKTDNDDLFEWSLQEFDAMQLEAEAISRDLWNSEFAAGNVLTEYETKFGDSGKSINYIKLRLK